METFRSSESIIFQAWLHTVTTWGALKILIVGIHVQRSPLNWPGVQPGDGILMCSQGGEPEPQSQSSAITNPHS